MWSRLPRSSWLPTRPRMNGGTDCSDTYKDGADPHVLRLSAAGFGDVGHACADTEPMSMACRFLRPSNVQAQDQTPVTTSSALPLTPAAERHEDDLAAVELVEVPIRRRRRRCMLANNLSLVFRRCANDGRASAALGSAPRLVEPPLREIGRLDPELRRAHIAEHE